MGTVFNLTINIMSFVVDRHFQSFTCLSFTGKEFQLHVRFI